MPNDRNVPVTLCCQFNEFFVLPLSKGAYGKQTCTHRSEFLIHVSKLAGKTQGVIRLCPLVLAGGVK